MELTSDAMLKGPIWHNTLEKLVGTVFDTQWDVYALCITIGMMYDSTIETESMVPADYEIEPHSVGRNVLGKAQNKSLLEFMFQSALVTTKHLDLDEDTRLELAFNENEKPDFNPISFLTRFANFGITKVAEVIEDTDGVETLEALMTFLNSTYESGANALEDEFLTVEDFS